MRRRILWLIQRQLKLRWSFIVVLILIASSLLSGCANPEMANLFEQLAAQNQAILQAQGAAPSNRLLIQGVDGNLYTVRPDGSERVTITNDATSLHQYTQPTWSPTGSRIAWAEVDGRTGQLKSTLTVSHFDGKVREHFDLPFAPFYMYWSPDEARLAFLSNWQKLNQSSVTIALRLVDFAAEGERITTLTEGQPLYLDWSPESDRLLIHIDNDRLEYWDMLGEGASLSATYAAFPAPQWSSDGSQLLYALGESNEQQLVLADTEGNPTREITDFEQNISFTLSPDNRHIAYVITPPTVATAAFGPLYVVELASNRTRELASGPVMAFFWSPDGSKLAYLVIDESEATLRLRWHVWDGASSKPYAAMIPSRTFMQAYLAFFDQYARSMNIWSPDSSAFAYAAIDDTLGNNIWVQHLEEAEPQRVSRGVFVAWSPR
jgi:TolB protein